MKSLNPEMTQQLYEVLSNSSVRDYSGYECFRPLSMKAKVDGDIVYFLEDLIDRAHRQLELDPAEVLADVVDRGIVSWCLALEPPERARLGLDALAEVDNLDVFEFDGPEDGADHAKDRVPVATEKLEEKKEQQLQAIGNLERIRKRIARQLEEERAKSAKLDIEIAEMKEDLARAEDDAQPVNLPAYDAYFSPYTQLTAHVFAPELIEGPTGANPKSPRENSRRRDGGVPGNGSGRTRRLR